MIHTIWFSISILCFIGMSFFRLGEFSSMILLICFLHLCHGFLLSDAYTTWLLVSSWFHFMAVAVISGHPMVVASPKCWGFLVQFSAITTYMFSWWCQDSTPLHFPLLVGIQLPLRLHSHQWPFLASQRAELQLVFMTLSCFQNQYPPCWYLHITDSCCPYEIQPWLPLEPSFFVLSGNTSQKL